VQNHSDNALVSRVLRGETEAFRAIVERHQTRIFFLGLKFLHNRHDAEDFAQEVFLRAFEKLATFQGKVPFSAWLYRIGYNAAVNRYHARRRQSLALRRISDPTDSAPGPEAGLLRSELLEKARKILKRIPETYKVIIKLHFFEGLSYAEISKRMSIPVNTIKSHVFRAKQLIRQRLGSYVRGYAEGGAL
jgi:RNA polymerase sigma-70 factor (ECF subfamily)